MRSTTQLRQVWAPPCKIQRVTFTFWSGAKVTVDARISEALRALDQCFKGWNYKPRTGETWGYNCRKITGGSGYSLHAYGISVDVNSRANPYGKRLITDMPAPMIQAIKNIRTKGGHQVWGWGGDYRNVKDAMHFEVVASPDELKTGIDPSSVHRQPIPPAEPEPAPQRKRTMIFIKHRDDHPTDPQRIYMVGPDRLWPVVNWPHFLYLIGETGQKYPECVRIAPDDDGVWNLPVDDAA